MNYKHFKIKEALTQRENITDNTLNQLIFGEVETRYIREKLNNKLFIYIL